MKRFVILHHRIGRDLSRTDESHFDWMFETESRLKTFASPIVASWKSAFDLDAIRLSDHRIAYLTWEGPLQPKPDHPHRGSVHRIIAGEYETLQDSIDRFDVQLKIESAGGSTGRVIFERTDRGDPGKDSNPEDGDRWNLRFSPGSQG